MVSHYGIKFDHVHRLLIRHCPLSTPIKVVTKDLSEFKQCGNCTTYLNPNGSISKFVLAIDRGLGLCSAIDTLLHEWAHAMDSEANGVPTECHRNTWGECYAKTWRVYVNQPADG
jgi:hypothetical protein